MIALCQVCGDGIQRQEDYAGYGGPYGGGSLLMRWRYRNGRHFIGEWHISCRPEWANPWRDGGPRWVYSD